MQVTINHECTQITGRVEYFAHVDVVGGLSPSASVHYRVFASGNSIEEITCESKHDGMFQPSELWGTRAIIYVVDNMHADYVLIWNIHEARDERCTTIFIDLADVIRSNFKMLAKQPLYSGSYTAQITAFNVHVLGEGNNYHSSHSAVMRVHEGKVIAREDKLMGYDIRGITFKHSDSSNNIFISTQREIMAHATPHISTMQHYYDNAINCIHTPEKYGVSGHKPTPTTQITEMVAALEINKKYTISTTYKIVSKKNQRPVIKFDRCVDAGDFRFKFIVKNTPDIYVIFDSDAQDEPVYGVTYSTTNTAEILFPPGTRAQRFTFYTNDQIINNCLVSIEPR